MIFNTTKITDICIKLRINIEQFHFLYLVYTRDYKNMKRYIKSINGWSPEFNENLEKKGLLLNHNTTHKPEDKDKDGKLIVRADKFYSSPEFDALMEESEIAADLSNAYEELLDNYPYEIDANGKKLNARTGVGDHNAAKYKDYLLKYPDMHQKIIAATIYGKEQGLIKYGLEKYIDGRLWGGIIETMKDSERNDTLGEEKYGDNEF